MAATGRRWRLACPRRCRSAPALWPRMSPDRPPDGRAGRRQFTRRRPTSDQGRRTRCRPTQRPRTRHTRACCPGLQRLGAASGGAATFQPRCLSRLPPNPVMRSARTIDLTGGTVSGIDPLGLVDLAIRLSSPSTIVGIACPSERLAAPTPTADGATAASGANDMKCLHRSRQIPINYKWFFALRQSDEVLFRCATLCGRSAARACLPSSHARPRRPYPASAGGPIAASVAVSSGGSPLHRCWRDRRRCRHVDGRTRRRRPTGRCCPQGHAPGEAAGIGSRPHRCRGRMRRSPRRRRSLSRLALALSRLATLGRQGECTEDQRQGPYEAASDPSTKARKTQASVLSNLCDFHHVF